MVSFSLSDSLTFMILFMFACFLSTNSPSIAFGVGMGGNDGESNEGSDEPPDIECDPDAPITSELITAGCPDDESDGSDDEDDESDGSDDEDDESDGSDDEDDIICDPDAPITSELVAVDCPEICDNGIDDNNDGLTDEEDEICSDFENHKPIARASGPGTVKEGDTISLTGDGEDEDDDILTYSWTQTGGPTVSLSDSTSDTPSLVAPIVGTDTPCIDGLPTTILTFQLVVSDVEEDSSPSSVEVKVTRNTEPLTLTAGGQAIARSNEFVMVTSKATGGSGCGEIKYAWTQTGGATGVISSSSSSSPGFKTGSPAEAEDAILKVVATDGDEKTSVEAEIAIKVCPSRLIASLANRESNIPDISSGDCDYSRIDVRATSAGPFTSAHLFIVFTEKNGQETIFRGGPRDNPLLGGGKIRVDWGNYEPPSGTGYEAGLDWDINAASVTLLKGPAAFGKDNCFGNQGSRINGAMIDYELLGPNSNTVVKTLLAKCGVPVGKPNGSFPGFNDEPL